MRRPVIGIPCDVKFVGRADFHAVGEKYIAAVQGAVGDVVLLPAWGDMNILKRLLPGLDGIFLTGSLSNVKPSRYGSELADPNTLLDEKRDNTTLPLIEHVLEIGMPLFGVCRGFQEMNVALGGTLYQKVQEVPGMMDHREPGDTIDSNILYADAHTISLAENSLLKQWMGGTNETMVNSLHQQGVKDLAPGLTAEAHAPDGLIEAFRVTDAKTFAYAVQWHPEWLYTEKAASIALFKAFHDACVEYAAATAGR